jgi:YggT family protein
MISYILRFYELLILMNVIFSWINVSNYNPIVKFIYKVTEPVLAPIRHVMLPVAGLDFSPLIVILILEFLQKMI